MPAGLLLAVFLLRLPSVIGEFGIASPDEVAWIIRHISRICLGDLNPGIFEYPTGATFLVSGAAFNLVFVIGRACGVYHDLPGFVLQMQAHPWPFTVIARLLVLLGGVLGVVALHRLALRVTSPAAATWAAAAFGLTLPFVRATNYVQVDIVGITWLLFGLIGCLDILEGRRDTRTLVLTGICFGSLINTKFPYVLCVVAVAAALWFAPDRERRIADQPRLRHAMPLVLLCALGLTVWFFSNLLPAPPPAADESMALGIGAVANFRRSVRGLAVLLFGAGVAGLAIPAVRRVANAAYRSRTARVTALAAAVTFLVWSPYYFADPLETLMCVIRMMRPVDFESLGPRPVTWHLRILERSAGELLCVPVALLGLLGVLRALHKRDPRDLVILSPALLWFAYTGLAAYSKLGLMLIFAPFIALYAARFALESLGRAGHAAMALALLWPAALALQLCWANARAPHQDTRNALYAWYGEACPTGERIAQDPNLLIVNARNPGIYQTPLVSVDLAELKSQGIRYVLVNEGIVDQFKFSAAQVAEFRARLERAAERVAHFEPEPGRVAGPTIDVWRLK